MNCLRNFALRLKWQLKKKKKKHNKCPFNIGAIKYILRRFSRLVRDISWRLSNRRIVKLMSAFKRAKRSGQSGEAAGIGDKRNGLNYAWIVMYHHLILAAEQRVSASGFIAIRVSNKAHNIQSAWCVSARVASKVLRDLEPRRTLVVTDPTRWKITGYLVKVVSMLTFAREPYIHSHPYFSRLGIFNKIITHRRR